MAGDILLRVKLGADRDALDRSDVAVGGDQPRRDELAAQVQVLTVARRQRPADLSDPAATQTQVDSFASLPGDPDVAQRRNGLGRLRRRPAAANESRRASRE